MAYNRRNLLTRVGWIQDITLEHTRRGVTQEWVYNNIIFPTYRISRRTYYNYLSINARKELGKLLAASDRQLQLF